MSRLAIVGSTEPCSPQEAIALVNMAVHWFQPKVIVSGGANGIDRLAANAAKHWGIELAEHLPENQRWAPNGFKDRNTRIAEDCTHLIRIANRNSTTYGSGWTADYAQKLDKPVYRFYL